MKSYLITVTLILSSFVHAQNYTCPEIETSEQRCVLETTAMSSDHSAVDTTLHSERYTKRIFDALIKVEKNIPLRLIYSTNERVASPVQRVVIISKKIPKAKTVAPAIKDDSRYVAFVHAAKACLETDDTGVPIRQTQGCDVVRANAMKYTLLTYAVMTGRSLQTLVDLINVNPAVQEDLVKSLRTQDELPKEAWDAHYKHMIRGRVSKFNAYDYSIIIDTYSNKDFLRP